jgi:hypothetical protein
MDPPAPQRRKRPRRIWIHYVPIALFAAIAVLPTTGAGGLSPIYGFKTPDGHFVLPYAVGLYTTDSVFPGSTVFGDALTLEVTPNGHNSTIVVSSNQSGHPNLTYSESFAVDAYNITTIGFTLPSDTNPSDTKLCVDGACMTFVHATPLTLFPSGVLNIGGLDLVVFSTVVEFAVISVALLPLARYLCRKALWSPRFRIELLIPHLIAFVVIGTALDFQAFDTFFGGYAFILYAPMFAIPVFFWQLHFFNVAKPVEVLRPDPQGGHRLRYNRWRIWVGDLPDGRKILVGTRWRDWWARLFGHFPVLVAADVDGTKIGPPSESPLVTWRAEVRGERHDKRVAAFRSRTNRDTPLDDFLIAGDLDYREKDAPVKLLWVDSNRWLDTSMPHFSAHRKVPVPAKYKDGVQVEPATEKNRWCFPYYVDVAPQISLAGLHYIDVPAAALGWISAERAYRRVEDLRLSNNALRVGQFDIADESAETRTAEIYRLLHRDRMPMSDAEATEDVRREPPVARQGDTGASADDRPPIGRGKPTGAGP